MNREKKQLLVVIVLAVLILAVGAFQFMKGSEPEPVASTKKDEAKPNDPAKDAKLAKLYPELMPLAQKDPFLPASFVNNKPEQPVTPPADPKPVKQVETGLDPLPPDGWVIPGGDPKVEPLKPVTPPKPVFGYILVGIVEGAHPSAVFDDGKGNQQLVEVGQGIGPNATITKITRGKVHVKFNAETLVFNVGGNPNAK